MTMFDDLKAEHQRLLAKHDAGGDETILLAAAQDYVQRIRLESEQVIDPRNRDQLRAYLRFWGAYLYDQTGTYPDTSLRPSTIEPIEVKAINQPRKNFLSRYWIWFLGIFCIIALLAVFYFGLGNRRMMASPEITPTPKPVEENSTEVVTIPDSSLPPTLTDESVTEIGTEEVEAESPIETTTMMPTVIPSPTITPFPTNTRPPQTATVTASPTPVNVAAAPPPTKTSNATGGSAPSEEDVPPHLLLIAEVNGSNRDDWCTSRYLEVSVDNPELVFQQNASLTLQIDPAGDQQSFGQEIAMRAKEAVIMDLTAFQANNTYSLLHLEHPQYTSTDVIFRYASDCASEQLQVEYKTEERSSNVEPPRNPNLALVWHFVSWGPEPYYDRAESGRWFTLLELSGQGGDGTYIYWKFDETGSFGLLDSNQVLVYGYACEPAAMVAAVTSAGQTVTREIILQAPYCP